MQWLLVPFATHPLVEKILERFHTCFLEKVEKQVVFFSPTISLDPLGTHSLLEKNLEKLQMFPGGGGRGKGGPPLINWLLSPLGTYPLVIKNLKELQMFPGGGRGK
jgi:hypothetical protein